MTIASKSRSLPPVLSTVSVRSSVAPTSTVASMLSGSTPMTGAGRPSPVTSTVTVSLSTALLSIVSVPLMSPTDVGENVTGTSRAGSANPTVKGVSISTVKSSLSEVMLVTSRSSPPTLSTNRLSVASSFSIRLPKSISSGFTAMAAGPASTVISNGIRVDSAFGSFVVSASSFS